MTFRCLSLPMVCLTVLQRLGVTFSPGRPRIGSLTRPRTLPLVIRPTTTFIVSAPPATGLTRTKVLAVPPPAQGLKNSLPEEASIIRVTRPSRTGILLPARCLPLIDRRLTAPTLIPHPTSLTWAWSAPAARPRKKDPLTLTPLLLTYMSTVLKPCLTSGTPLGRISTLLWDILTLLLSARAIDTGGKVQLSLLLQAMTSPIRECPLEGRVIILLFPWTMLEVIPL